METKQKAFKCRVVGRAVLRATFLLARCQRRVSLSLRRARDLTQIGAQMTTLQGCQQTPEPIDPDEGESCLTRRCMRLIGAWPSHSWEPCS
ncbi:hypothetical protein AVEN_270074-1 [Araneus ventricosus]|uniref:Uncharacterized protein n=1 Tax=Araneus ventricosus TaxID=182803 RepID=A0A4Y2UKT5_ARAVE|nr:hypothetical protein AVEN_270074-1 [Araneus ventricosus]